MVGVGIRNLVLDKCEMPIRQQNGDFKAMKEIRSSMELVKVKNRLKY